MPGFALYRVAPVVALPTSPLEDELELLLEELEDELELLLEELEEELLELELLEELEEELLELELLEELEEELLELELLEELEDELTTGQAAALTPVSFTPIRSMLGRPEAVVARRVIVCAPAGKDNSMNSSPQVVQPLVEGPRPDLTLTPSTNTS